MSRNALFPAALAFALAAGPAFAQALMFKGDLTGGAENPPTMSKGLGSIEVTLDPSTRKITWKGEFKGLESAETGAHFHGPAQPGENAGPVVGAPAKKGVFEGSATLDAKQVKDLEDGKWYFNVHTSKHPDGELRGQLLRVR
ncbi:MAG: CHRD domain containing protein [Methylocystaceae bacterium]|nr:MAG: CHRD domain containing protein [Methylocystaceae bacterium]